MGERVDIGAQLMLLFGEGAGEDKGSAEVHKVREIISNRFETWLERVSERQS